MVFIRLGLTQWHSHWGAQEGGRVRKLPKICKKGEKSGKIGGKEENREDKGAFINTLVGGLGKMEGGPKKF